MIVNADSGKIPLRNKSVHLCVTSPPYLWQRIYDELPPSVFGGEEICEHDFVENSYKIEKKEVVYGICDKCGAFRGYLGLEPSMKFYIRNLVKGIFREVRRVLRDDGILVVNLGDKKNSISGGYYTNGREFDRPSRGATMMRGFGKDKLLEAKNLLDIHGRFARTMQRDGWIFRDEIIWYKETAMPSSVDGWKWIKHRLKVKSLRSYTQKTVVGVNDGRRDHSGDFRLNKSAEYVDCHGCEKCSENDGLILRYGSWRTTTAHEKIFVFSKKSRYFCDADAVRQPHAAKSFSVKTSPMKGNGTESAGEKLSSWLKSSGNGRRLNPSGANPRSVMTFPVEPLAEEHFAAFPSSLPEFFIKVGTSERGCCRKCGAPFARIIDRQRDFRSGSGKRWKETGAMPKGKNFGNILSGGETPDVRCGPVVFTSTLGWKATCKCQDAGELKPCIVLDPFLGSGRTAEAAIRLGRQWIGLELSPKYCAMAKRRLSGAIRRDGTTEVKSNLPQMELFDAHNGNAKNIKCHQS